MQKIRYHNSNNNDTNGENDDHKFTTTTNLREANGKDGVRATTGVVHIGWGRSSVFVAFVHQRFDVSKIHNDVFGKILELENLP